MAATRAAGTLIPPGKSGILRGVVAHVAMSGFWGAVLGAALPQRRTVLRGPAAGLGIAAIDLGRLGRRLPAIRAVPTAAQVADHIAFGTTFAMVLADRGRDQPTTRGAVVTTERGRFGSAATSSSSV